MSYVFKRKLRKLVRSPHAFLRDSTVIQSGMAATLRVFKPSEPVKAAPIIFPDRIEAKAQMSGIVPPGDVNVSDEQQFEPDWAPPAYHLPDDRPNLMYLPWIKGSGDALVAAVNRSDRYRIHPIRLVDNFNEERRIQISRVARERPVAWRRILLRHLVALKPHISGVVVTFDWHPVMRMLVKVCRELGIPTILVLHESVFMDAEKFYWHEETGVRLPIADFVVAWGDLQKDIFMKRGLAEKRIHVLGSPKLDECSQYVPSLTRRQFATTYGFAEHRRIFVFVMQPMDVQVDRAFGLRRQRQALEDLINYCERRKVHLLVREPSAQGGGLGDMLRERIMASSFVALDPAHDALTSALETLSHADMVFSVNSTMLLEATLMGRKAVTMRYFDFDDLWSRFGVPTVRDMAELVRLVDVYRYEEGTRATNLEEAARLFSAGSFDGRSAERIMNFIGDVAEARMLPPGDRTDVAATDDYVQFIAIANQAVIERAGEFIPRMLNAEKVWCPANSFEAALADRYVQWGVPRRKANADFREMLSTAGMRPFIIEDGFIRSIDLGLSGESGISISLGGDTAYYDSERVSRFEEWLQDGPALSEDQRIRAVGVMEMIKRHKVSKYNSSPFLPVQIGTEGRRKVLVVDQRYGDVSVSRAGADQSTFSNMLLDAISQNPDADIIIKRHPDAIKGGKGSYYADEHIGFVRGNPNVHLIDYDLHPHQLLEMVDKVYVCSSGLGMEALIFGLEVHTYGLAFYSGWGATVDAQTLARRSRRRDAVEIFHCAYIECSRYYDPDARGACDIEDAIRYIVRHRRVRVG